MKRNGCISMSMKNQRSCVRVAVQLLHGRWVAVYRTRQGPGSGRAAAGADRNGLSRTALTRSFLDRYNFGPPLGVQHDCRESHHGRITGKINDQSLLFQYTVKLVLFVSFSELILYRLVSRFGMHLSKLAQTHEWIIPTFTALTEIGQWLLNVVAILLFLGLGVGVVNRMAGRGFVGSNMIVVPCVAAPVAPHGRVSC